MKVESHSGKDDWKENCRAYKTIKTMERDTRFYLLYFENGPLLILPPASVKCNSQFITR